MSDYLLDTCALLWWMADAPELGRAARRAIGDRRNRIVVSAATLWEIAIKQRKGRLSGVDDSLHLQRPVRQRVGCVTLAQEAFSRHIARLLQTQHDLIAPQRVHADQPARLFPRVLLDRRRIDAKRHCVIAPSTAEAKQSRNVATTTSGSE